MTTWTEDNTEGFTAAELDAMNDAQERLESAFGGVDSKHISDRLNNAFCPGMTADDLVEAVSARLTAERCSKRRETMTLIAEKTSGMMTVRDTDGGRWFPSDEALAEIEASADQEAAALRICDEQPTRGEWRQ